MTSSSVARRGYVSRFSLRVKQIEYYLPKARLAAKRIILKPKQIPEWCSPWLNLPQLFVLYMILTNALQVQDNGKKNIKLFFYICIVQDEMKVNHCKCVYNR